MIYAIRTELSNEISSRIPGLTIMKTTSNGLSIHISMHGRKAAEHYETHHLPGVEEILAGYGINVASRQISEIEIVLNATLDHETDKKLLAFVGRADRISSWTSGAAPGHVLLLDGTIVPIPWTMCELALTRDGDDIEVEYRRYDNGEIRVHAFRNLTLPKL